MRVLVLVIAVGFCHLSPGVTLADQKAEARAAFKEGRALFNEGKYTEAADAFRRAHGLSPNWKLYYNIGQSEAAAKRYGLSLEAFEAYLARGGDEIPENRQLQVRKEVKRLREMVGLLEIKASSGVTVVVDGVARGEAPLPGIIPVASGVNHKIIALRDGVEVASRVVKVLGGQSAEIELISTVQSPDGEVTPTGVAGEGDAAGSIVPGEQEDAAGSVSAAAGKQKSALRTWGWVTTGVGAALLVGGVITGGTALAKDADIADNCPGGVCGSDWQDTVDSRDNLGTSTNVLLAAGGAVAVAGVVMLIMSYTGSDETPERVAVRVAPMFSPRAVGAAMEWRF